MSRINRCHFYVHGVAELSRDDLREVSLADFALFRRLGIDSLYLDMYAELDQPHLDPAALLRRLDVMRRGLSRLMDMAPVREALRAAVAGDTPEVERVELPLCHPRKAITPGAVYIEFRHIYHIRRNDDPRYKARYMSVPAPEGVLRVVHIDHLHTLARDLSELLDVGLIVGRELAGAIESGAQEWRRVTTKSSAAGSYHLPITSCETTAAPPGELAERGRFTPSRACWAEPWSTRKS